MSARPKRDEFLAYPSAVPIYHRAAFAVAVLLLLSSCGADGGSDPATIAKNVSAQSSPGATDQPSAGAEEEPSQTDVGGSAITATACPSSEQLIDILGTTVTADQNLPIDLSSMGSSNYPQPCTWYSEYDALKNEFPELSVVLSLYPPQYKYMEDTLPAARDAIGPVAGVEMGISDAPEFGKDAFSVHYEGEGMGQCTYFTYSNNDLVTTLAVQNANLDPSANICDQAAEILALLY